MCFSYCMIVLASHTIYFIDYRSIFDLWFLCLFHNQLEHQEVHGSHIAEAWLLQEEEKLENFEHYFSSM